MSASTRLLLFGLLVAAACAHEQPIASAPPHPPPAVTPPPPAPQAAPAPPRENADAALARLIGQPISHFAFDKADLTTEDERQLQALSDALKLDGPAHIQIAGNCDERGTEEYNLLLGQKRAEVAKRYLSQLGVDPARLDTISYGKDRPLEEGHDEAAWAANRRDDATLLPHVSNR